MLGLRKRLEGEEEDSMQGFFLKLFSFSLLLFSLSACGKLSEKVIEVCNATYPESDQALRLSCYGGAFKYMDLFHSEVDQSKIEKDFFSFCEECVLRGDKKEECQTRYYLDKYESYGQLSGFEDLDTSALWLSQSMERLDACLLGVDKMKEALEEESDSR